MDTIEQLNGTYFYKGLHNLSAGELFFWVFLDEAQRQLNVDDDSTCPFHLGSTNENHQRKASWSNQRNQLLKPEFKALDQY